MAGQRAAGDRPAAAPPSRGRKRVQAEHLLDFEALKAVPDQLVTYFFWAEDIGPDGQPRRTSGDMFFAEVRHFEEIFRQGEQPPSGSAENEEQEQGRATPSEADQLAELQKEIINGTWKLIRRETGRQADRQVRRGRQGPAASRSSRRSSRPAQLASGCGTRRRRRASNRRRSS